MHMRKKQVEAVRGGRSVGENVIAKFAQPGAEIAYEILVAAGDDLDAAGVAAKGAADREGQVTVDKAVDRLGGGQAAAACGEQRVADFRADRTMPQRRRQRSAGAPEPHWDEPTRARPGDLHGLSPRARFAGVCSGDPVRASSRNQAGQ